MVDLYHTNGIAERIIRNLHDNGWTVLMHSLQKWTDSVISNLCMYAIIQANEAYNYTPFPSDPNGHSTYQIFIDTIVNGNPKHWIPFGCPTYVLKQ